MHPKAAGDTFLISGDRPVTWAEYYDRYAQMLNTTVPSITPEESAARYRDADRRQHLLPQLKSVFRDVPDVRNRIMQTPEVHGLITTVKPFVPKRRWSAMKAQIATKPAPPDPKAAITGLPATSIEYYQAKMTVSIEKARTVLGYSPQYDLATGMELTAAWARWAHFIQ